MKYLIRLWCDLLRTQPVIVFSVLIGACLAGVYVAAQSEIEAFPELTNVQVQVISQYPGKASEEVERQVTIPVEIATTGLPGLANQRSISIFGLSVVTLTFEDNVISRQARLDVEQRLQDAGLPDGIKPALSPDSTPVGEIYRFVLKGNRSPAELRLIEDWTVEKAIKSIPGVADVVSFGGPQQTVDVKLDPAKLKLLGLNFDTVAQNVGQNHVNAGGGMIAHGQENYLVRSIGLIETAKALESAVITTSKNTPIHIRDIGRVELGNKLRLGQVGHNSDDDVIEGIVLLRQGADTLGTCEKIRQKLKFLNEQTFPKDVKIESIYDRTDLISRSGHTVFHNIFFGIFLVCLVLLTGFGRHHWMMVLSVVLVIPFALICAFVGVRIFGYKPNLISLGAVDFGIIVETAIFASEAVIVGMVSRLNAKRKSLEEVLAEVFGPALLCALLLIIAFIPILSLGQVEGRIFRPLGITLVAALVGGQLGAIIFIPLFARYCPVEDFHQTRFDQWLDHLRAMSLKAVAKVNQVKALPLLTGIVLLAAIAGLFLALGREFLPNLNEGSLYIRATGPATISREAAVQLASDVRTRLLKIPEVKEVVSQIGRPDDGTDINGFDNLELLVTLIEPSDWKSAKTIDGLTAIAQKSLSDLEGVELNFSQPIKDNVDEAISGVKGELVVKVIGPQVDKLQEIAEQIKKIVSEVPGAEDVAAEELKGQPELRFKMDHEKLARFGVRVADAESTLESALNGKVAAKLSDNEGRLVDIVVRADLPENLDTASLQSLPVIGADGSKVALGEVANIELVEGVSKIYREEGSRRIAVKCSVRNRAVVDFVKEASAKISSTIKLPEHYTTQWSGSFENANRASRQLAIIVPLCILVMIIILYTWFQSWASVGLILWEVPFSVVGSLAFLKMFQLNLSISAAAGIIVVIGVSFLTGIMLISDAKLLGSPMKGLEAKFKSIFISSTVAIIGLIPASFSNGIGSETAKPFAVCILGGLVTSYLLTTLVLPALMEKRKKEGNPVHGGNYGNKS